MKMKDKINIGDKVDIYWERIQCVNQAEVLYIPCATGDSWKLKEIDGTIIYVNTFGKMVKR